MQYSGNDTDRVPCSDDKLLGGGVVSADENHEGILGKNESDFELLEGDVNMSMVNEIPAIALSDPQPYPSTVMAWIHLPGLPGYLYKRKIIEAIGGLIGKIVEYEAFPTVCFSCGKYSHVKELSPSVGENSIARSFVDTTMVASNEAVGDGGEERRVDYGPWMLVERKSRRNLLDSRNGVAKSGKVSLGSRFAHLIVERDLRGDLRKSVEGFSGEKGEDSVVGGLMGNKNRVKFLKGLGYEVGVGRGTEADFRPSVGPFSMANNNRSSIVGLGLGMGLVHAKRDDAGLCGPSKVKLSGPSEDRRGSENKVGFSRGGVFLNYVEGGAEEISGGDDRQIGGLDSTSA
ncbi:hypothetical protein GOBAR_AA29742 [Gossypium barbadense]|uniref:DUF4283 domain-containing protein n=1 Tax=Gossypium barbadense TaxID=3634 RepID=A0A2P5WIL2_GOSBA|nr:hypothetical protein GOBAR_AA29742 [Gossypium barbadense]